MQLAGLGSRLGARIIDWVIAFSVSTIVVGGYCFARFGADYILNTSDGIGVVFVMTFLIPMGAAVVGLACDAALVAKRGQTLGKMAMGIKVVREDNGLLPEWPPALKRVIIPYAPFMLMLLGWLVSPLTYVSVTWDRTRKGWHDQLAGTLVVKA